MKTNLNFNKLLFDNTLDNQIKQIEIDETNLNLNINSRAIEDKDNTLNKYFFEEKEKINNRSEIQEEKINLEKIELFYKKPIKLRNTLEKCYWDRQRMV